MGLFGGWMEKEKGPERIRGAVVRYNGTNFVDENHTKAHDTMLAEYPEMALTPEKEEARGWLTTRGRIVPLEEALLIKVASGQLEAEEAERIRRSLNE